jgi:intein-encoded DNA endonuclease-like protein
VLRGYKFVRRIVNRCFNRGSPRKEGIESTYGDTESLFNEVYEAVRQLLECVMISLELLVSCGRVIEGG